MGSTVGIRELKNGLSEYIDRVEAGEIITVTKRGKPVARVLPSTLPAGLAALIAQGRVEWSGVKPRPPSPVRLKGKGSSMAQYVAEGRR